MSVPTGPAPRFVVLEHRWGDIHWDLMLESGDALRTWALPAPPTPGLDVDARALADHRSIYLDYEGPISGDRGEVRRLYRGTYEPVAWGPGRIVVRLRGDQVIGEAELVREGDDERSGWRFRMMGKFI